MIHLTSSSSSSDHEDVPLIPHDEVPHEEDVPFVPHEEEVPHAGGGDIPEVPTIHLLRFGGDREELVPDDLVPEIEDDF